MAEVVGLAASIATLTSIVRVAIDLAKHGPNIPKEIEQVSRELEEISFHLDLLHDILEYTRLCFNPKARIFLSLQDNLHKNIDEFRTIVESLSHLAARSKGTRGRLCWLLIGRDEALFQTRRLQDKRSALGLTLNLFNTAFNLLQLLSPDKLRVLNQNYSNASLVSSTNDVETQSLCLEHTRIGQPVNYASSNANLFLPFWPNNCEASAISKAIYQIPFLGRAAVTFLTGRSTTSRHEFALWLSLPCSRVFIVRALLSSRSWLNFNIRSSLRVSRIVDDNSPFLAACSAGNTSLIDRMLLEGSATVEDRTQHNESSLLLAIHSRSYDAVKLLLERGADVNSLFGQNQTSPLAIAVQTRNAEIVRLLLLYGADCHHVTSYGWTPLFYLWWGTSNQFDFVDQAEAILQILVGRSDFLYTYSGVIDTVSFAAIHMAVMRGTIPQLRLLLKLDPDLAYVTGLLGWTAIHVAVYEGRLDMLELLLPFHDLVDILAAKDGRGWTLLHTSAAEGDSKVTRYLLQKGAKWQELSTPSLEAVPDTLKGRCCTPLEAASAESLTRRLAYLKDVKEVLGESYLSDEELEELDEDWADAASVMTC